MGLNLKVGLKYFGSTVNDTNFLTLMGKFIYVYYLNFITYVFDRNSDCPTK